MTRRLSLPVLLVLLLAGLLGCQVAPQEASLARVRGAGKLAVGVDPSYPPFSLLDAQGRPAGFEIELSGEIARRLGVAPDFVGIDVGGIVDALIARKIDVIIAGLAPFPEYGKQLVYSRPYFNAGQVLVVPLGGPDSLAGMAGKTVGVENGSTGDLEVRKLAGAIPSLHVKSYSDIAAAMEDLRAGRLDGAVTDIVSAVQFLRENEGLVIAGPPFTQEYYVVATRRGDSSLSAAVNRILGDLDQEQYLRALEDEWLR